MRKRYQDPIFTSQSRRSNGTGILIIIALICILLTAVGLNILNNKTVKVVKQSITLPNIQKNVEGIKILHISDLHGTYFGENQEDFQKAIEKERYNVVTISGDMVDKEGNFSAFIKMLEVLKKDVPVYFVPGDEDPAPIVPPTDNNQNIKAEYVLAAEKMGAVYLDAPVLIQQGNGSSQNSVWLCPDSFFTLDSENLERTLNSYKESLLKQEQTLSTQRELQSIEYQMDVIKRSNEAKLQMLSSDVYICLTHEPYTSTFIDTQKDALHASAAVSFESISLVLSGHYCNGQFRLPFVGAVWAPKEWALSNSGFFPDNNRISGLKIVHGITQYINPGLSTSNVYPLFPVRFYNAPSVSVLSFTTKLQTH